MARKEFHIQEPAWNKKGTGSIDDVSKNMLTNKMVGPVADVTRADGYLSQLQTGNEGTIFELNKVKDK